MSIRAHFRTFDFCFSTRWLLLKFPLHSNDYHSFRIYFSSLFFFILFFMNEGFQYNFGLCSFFLPSSVHVQYQTTTHFINEDEIKYVDDEGAKKSVNAQNCLSKKNGTMLVIKIRHRITTTTIMKKKKKRIFNGISDC